MKDNEEEVGKTGNEGRGRNGEIKMEMGREGREMKERSKSEKK